MKRKLHSAISGLLALGGACLLFTVIANAAPSGEPMNSYSPLGEKSVKTAWDEDSDDDSAGDRHWRRDVSFVVGGAYTAMRETNVEPNFSWYLKRTYAVVRTWRGARGHIFLDYREDYDDGGVFETTYVIKADCLEVDKSTREAWIGGEVVYVDGPFPNLGDRIVEYADDNDGGNFLNPDIQGTSYWGPPGSTPPEFHCSKRPPVLDWSYAESDRGKIVVR